MTLQKILFFILIFTSLTSCSDDDKLEQLKSNEKQILEFIVNGKSATIDENEKTITLFLDSVDVSQLTPSIKISEGASVWPVSGDSLDFTNPLVYRVLAEDGSFQDYTVTISSHEFQTVITKVSIHRFDFEPPIVPIFEIEGKFAARGNIVELYNKEHSYFETRVFRQMDSTLWVPYDISIEPGVYNLSVTSVGVTTVYNESIIIEEPSMPVISSINKTFLEEGRTDEELIITGSNFSKNIRLGYKESSTNYFFDASKNLSINDEGTEIKANLPSDLTPGEYQIVVSGSVYMSNIVIINVVENNNPVPIISSISNLNPTFDEIVIINGANFSSINDTKIDIYTYYSWGNDPDDYSYNYFLTSTPKTVTPTSITTSFGIVGKFKIKIRANGKESDFSDEISIY